MNRHLAERWQLTLVALLTLSTTTWDDQIKISEQLLEIPSFNWNWEIVAAAMRVESKHNNAAARITILKLIASRVEYWQMIDGKLHYSYEVIKANAKSGIDLLVRAALIDEGDEVRLEAVEILKKLGDLDALKVVAMSPLLAVCFAEIEARVTLLAEMVTNTLN